MRRPENLRAQSRERYRGHNSNNTGDYKPRGGRGANYRNGGGHIGNNYDKNMGPPKNYNDRY